VRAVPTVVQSSSPALEVTSSFSQTAPRHRVCRRRDTMP
jgi:hypothetical protein